MKPIIFDPVSVTAILAGRKTQTRPVVKPQPPDWLASQIDSGFRQVRHIHSDQFGAFVAAGAVSVCSSDTTIRCRYGGPGARLWVREKWAKVPATACRASRLTLEIVSVRVERLQDISEDDCVAEGVGDGVTHRPGFHRHWDRINGKRAPWASNPWVWAIEVKAVQ